jgi:uncharacterized membrane protein YfcA
MILPPLTPGEWVLAIFAALSVGLSKSGLAGFGMVTVVLMAQIMEAKASTGTVLPLLICGDFLAVGVFQKHAQWKYIRLLLPPALAGVIAGYFLMGQIPDRLFKPVIGWVVVILVLIEYVRRFCPRPFERVPHTRWFGWMMGGWMGITTMLANAAGPVMAIYLLSVNLPRFEFIGTTAWYFCVVNLFKVPFSASLGLITVSSLSFNLALFPAVAAGIFIGKWIIKHVPQRVFEQAVLIFAGMAALRLIGVF